MKTSLSKQVMFLAIFLSSIGLGLSGQSVTLAWDPSIDTNVTSYVLYYGNFSGSYTLQTNVGMATLATVSNLASGKWFFVVTARDDISGLESLPSNEVWCYIGGPSPPKRLRIPVELQGAYWPTGPWSNYWVSFPEIPMSTNQQFFRVRLSL